MVSISTCSSSMAGKEMQRAMAGSGSESESVIVVDGRLMVEYVWLCGDTGGSIMATGGAVIDGSSRVGYWANSGCTRAECITDSERRRPLSVTVLCSSVDVGECRSNGELHKLLSKR